MVRFFMQYSLVGMLSIAAILAMIMPVREIGRWELHRQRKTCPTCRDDLAVILVDDPSRLCFTHRKRLTKIQQLERGELSP